MGRAFASPAADSIYVSFILKPIDGAEGTPFVTIMAAVAVCETIESVAGGEPRVKWVNDIYMDGRKVCGILAESVAGAAGGGPGAVVLGIGVNVNVPPGDFPEELRDRAGAVRMAPARRGLFAAELIRRVIDRHEELARGESPIQAYRERSLIIGREVVVIGPDGGETPAMAEGIADNGNLLVRYADGSRAALNSGEVSLRVT
jgi:BirA family biotin operon repressor/biotin-[acetyl-CoA-carboxylase] ligase